MRKEKLILRIYRLSKKQDIFVKRQAKLEKVSNSAYIRYLITNDMARNLKEFKMVYKRS